MKNELFSIGPLTVYGYGLMVALGVLSAYLTMEYRARKAKLNHDFIFVLLVWCLIGGYAGSRLLYFITVFDEVLANPKILFDFSDGYVVYGGIIGGIITAWILCKIKKISFIKYFDLAMPSVALAQALGRIGCFLAGCCYGRETDSHFHLVFPESSYAPAGVPLVPTQLLSSGLNFLHCIVLLLIAKYVKKDGVVASCYLIFYSIGRFILEFYRGDLLRGNVGTLSTSQFISIFLFFAGVGLLLWFLFKKNKKATA